MDDSWQLAFLLPDLTLSSAIGLDDIVIVPYEDERLKGICNSSDEAKKLVEGFTDEQGSQVFPSALIVKSDLLTKLDLGALVDFRNAVALASTLYPNPPLIAPAYSDFFDFHPTVLAQEEGLITQSPATLNYSSSDTPFEGKTSPNLPHPDFAIPFSIDHKILNAFLHFWTLRSRRKKSISFSRALFRSIEVAYQASSTPFKNQGSLHDYGISSALWVSAIEVLTYHLFARPDDRDVLKSDAVTLIGEYDWHSWKLNSKWYKIPGNWPPHKGNLIQNLCMRLYNARNAFIHGNRVTASTLRSHKHKPDAPPLPKTAPAIYRTALIQSMSHRLGSEKLRAVSESNLNGIISVGIDMSYEDLLLRVINPEEE